MKKILLLFCLLLPFFAHAQQPPACQVKKITVYTNALKRGENPAYNPAGDSIVYQKLYLNGNWEIALSDTALNSTHCLTCDTSLLPAEIRQHKHKGNAEYSPDGNYILFTSENQHGFHLPTNVPGAGVNHDIFLMTRDGQQFWKLTNQPGGHGILHPAFSHDGKKIFWSEMYQVPSWTPPQGQEYGLWQLRYADFDTTGGTPHLSNIVSFMPRDTGWYESHSVSPDGSKLCFTSHFTDSTAFYGDITILDTSDIGTTNVINLTNSPLIHDEHGHFSPDGNKISYMSGPYIGGLTSFISDLYLMDNNGANPTRLTHFSQIGYPEYIQDTVVTADHYWSPDGTRIFGFIHFINSASLWVSELYVVEFMGPCGLDSMTAVLQTAQQEQALKIFPNPAQEKLTVEVPQQIFDLEICDVTGRRVFAQQHIAEKTEIDSRAFPNGMYLVRIANGKGSVVRKLIVQHR